MISNAFLQDFNFPLNDSNGNEFTAEEIEKRNAEETTKLNDITREFNEAEEKIEMCFTDLAKVSNWCSYVNEYGVNRTFMSVLNADEDFREKTTRRILPRPEMLSDFGDPISAVSQSVIEGLEDWKQSLKDWAQKVWERLKELIRKLLVFLRLKEANTGDRINRILKQLEKIGDVTVPEVEMIPETSLRDIDKEVKKAMNDIGNKNVSYQDVKTQINSLTQISTQTTKMNASCRNVSTSDIKNTYIKWIREYETNIVKTRDILGRLEKEVDDLRRSAQGVGVTDESLIRAQSKQLTERLRLANNLLGSQTKYQSAAFVSIGRWITEARKIKK